jgi:uncharacterized RDD family membrane protein YckC
VIKTCQQCGAVHGEPADICQFCDAPLGSAGRAKAESRRENAPTEGNLAVQPEWRREVSSRLYSYRARRQGGPAASAQSTLPFEPISLPDHDSNPASLLVEPTPADLPKAPRQQRVERFEISIPKHEPQPVDPAMQRAEAVNRSFETSPHGTFPVAPMKQRVRAGVLDIALLLFTYGGMLALFHAMGGQIGFSKVDVMVTAATLALFYAQYFALFTVFGGCTPGMMVRGLRVVSFDGSVPTFQQMVWRSLGYLLSAGTFFLGFLWALWDEDHLCWQDRLSRTYLTPIDSLTVDEAEPPAEQR